MKASQTPRDAEMNPKLCFIDARPHSPLTSLVLKSLVGSEVRQLPLVQIREHSIPLVTSLHLPRRLVFLMKC